jgi:uncharacterized protein YyaL (SSP411 family)
MLGGCGNTGPQEESSDPATVIVADSTQVTTAYPSTDASVRWRVWNAATIAEAQRLERPLLLYVATAGADGLLAEEDELVRSLAQERFVPVHVDPWLYPELDRRYGGAWPTLSIVMPDGALVAQAPDIAPDRVRVFLLRMLAHLQDRPEIVQAHIAEKSVARAPLDAEALLRAATEAFDAIHGGFGPGSGQSASGQNGFSQVAKHPEATLLSFLVAYEAVHEGSMAGRMLRRTLDGLVAGDLWNRTQGPFVYAHTASWELPRREVDAAVVAGLLQVLQSQVSNTASDDHAVRELQELIVNRLFSEQLQAFIGRRLPLDENRWWSDPILYADRVAFMTWILYDNHDTMSVELQRMRRSAAATLSTMVSAEGIVDHAHDDGRPLGSRGLLRDQMLVSLALAAAARVESREDWSMAAQLTWSWARSSLFDPQIGAFVDCLAPEGLANWPIRTPFADDMLPAGNALAALLLLRQGEPEQARQLLQRVPRHPMLRAHASAARVQLQLENGA